MSGVERLGKLTSDTHHLCQRQGTARDETFQRLALDVLEDEDNFTVVFDDVEERRDVLMAECGDRARFPQKPFT